MRSAAVVCIVIVLVAGALPAMASALGAALLVALWIVTPSVAVTFIRRIALQSGEQPFSLLALPKLRGPPHC